MITPDEIRAKAERWYPQAVAAWLAGQETYPWPIRGNYRPSPGVSQAIAEQQLLRDHAKDVRGFGYTLIFEQRSSRSYGQQRFAVGAQFDSREDLLRLVGKLTEFQRLTRVVQQIRERQPRLESWLQTHWKRLIDLGPEVSQLLDVVDYLQAHPLPGCFVRELPLAISTKLIESHTSLLAQWLDLVLPAESIDFTFDHKHFASRYGFRAKDDQLWLRILDEQLQAELRCPGSELGLPLATLARLPVRDAQVIIVENKINLLTLPMRPRTVALGGLGKAVSRLFRIPWIDPLPIEYFGDLDVEGLEILSLVRRHWPQTVSCMMDSETLLEFESLVIPGSGSQPERPPPSELTLPERQAFEICRDRNWRLEQERLPQSIITSRLGLATTREGEVPPEPSAPSAEAVPLGLRN